MVRVHWPPGATSKDEEKWTGRLHNANIAEILHFIGIYLRRGIIWKPLNIITLSEKLQFFNNCVENLADYESSVTNRGHEFISFYFKLIS